MQPLRTNAPAVTPLPVAAPRAPHLSVTAIPGIPDIRPGDDLAGLLLDALDAAAMSLQDGDILVIAHKVVSKAEGCIRRLREVTPGDEALRLARELDKDPRKVQVILDESRRVVRSMKRADQREGTLITEHRLGFVCANAAVDESNVGCADQVILLPEDPDRSARALCARLRDATGARIGVVISDTFGRPWRLGLVNVAVGLAEVPGKVDLAGERDAFGRELAVTAPALADELAAASGLLMSKEGKRPAILFRGVDWEPDGGSARDLVRPPGEDLFR